MYDGHFTTCPSYFRAGVTSKQPVLALVKISIKSKMTIILMKYNGGEVKKKTSKLSGVYFELR